MATWSLVEPDILAEGVLVAGGRTVRVTVEQGSVEAAEGDLLALKYAQGSYGLDLRVLEMVRRETPGIMDQLPLPNTWVVAAAPSELAARAVLFVGTPPILRFGYSAVRAWATNVLVAAGSSGLDVNTIVATLHGPNIGGGSSLDAVRALREQILGFREGLTRPGAAPSLEWIRIVELDVKRAHEIAGELEAAVEDRAMRAIADADLSRSVAGVRTRLTPDSVVTAGELAAQIRDLHPEYAEKRLDGVEFDVDAGRRDRVDHWLEQVARLYPRVRSGDAVLDGRRLLAGLAVLEREVGDALDAGDARERLLAEMQEPPGPAPEREHVGWSPDEPTDDDRLGRRLVARALGDQLLEYEREFRGTTFMFLIDGPWGSGKSTLLRFLSDNLNDRSPEELPAAGGPVIAEFDAWRQSRAGPPWLLLMTGLRSALRRDGELGRMRAVLERLRRVGRINVISVAVVVAVLVVLGALWAFDVVEPGRTTSIILASSAFLAGLWPTARAVGRLATQDTKRGARRFVETHRDPMEDVASHFAWLRGQTDRPIMLLIDDLDRCDPDYVVELLDSVQKLVRAQPDAVEPPTLFIGVAADGRWLREAYQAQHAGLSGAIGEPGRPLGSLFLDKIFQLRVPVPELSPSAQESFLRRLLDSAPVSDEGRAQRLGAAREQIERVRSTEVIDTLQTIDPDLRADVADVAFERLQADGASAEARHALERFAPLLEPNPRSVLRFTMAFSILRAVRTAEGNVVPTDELALWTVVSVRWPLLAGFLARDPELVSLFAAPADSLRGKAPAELVDVFADPDDDMRQVFNHEVGGPLHASVIRQCVGIA